jgi:hypothetical protein
VARRGATLSGQEIIDRDGHAAALLAGALAEAERDEARSCLRTRRKRRQRPEQTLTLRDRHRALSVQGPDSTAISAGAPPSQRFSSAGATVERRDAVG